MKRTGEGGIALPFSPTSCFLLFAYFYFINTYSYEIHCFYPTGQSVLSR